MGVRVTTDDLRRTVETLRDHLDALGQSEWDFGKDYYWNIPTEELYNPYEHPKELNLGQLADDPSELSRIRTGEAPPVGTALIWLAAVLRRVGEEVAG